ncbi:histidine phosphatase family protein [Pseudomonas putida]|uniref:histidine phosphatase family protein n=1 Tax=Pseudomonas putida TaxID=303 RepID=UPI000DB5AE20|nr:histidine phosphatase family protein [Pseudomonas putida]MBI6957188.1 histidine phosphatase family protein [Pseudomonas putida]PZQ36918.1 MAG: histidine phosphatase family protein [Pseudomonas putida]
MKAVHLTLLCHAQTQAQKVGRFHTPEDSLLPIADAPREEVATTVLTAPERRARDTAAWLCERAQVDPLLADCDLGNWQGLTLKQLQEEQSGALMQWLQDPCSAPHGGESFNQLRQRMTAWLDSFEGHGTWMAVTHPLVMRAVLMNVLDCPSVAAGRIDVLPLARLQLSFAGCWRLRLA